MQHIAEKNGWHQFVAMENHYNLLYREDERELIPICKQDGVMLMPYSPLAGGHLARSTWDSSSKRSQVDTSARSKYDHDEQQDLPIIKRVAKLAEKHNVKKQYLDDAAKAVEIELTPDEVAYLEEPYTAHEIVGALDKNPDGLLPKDVK